MNRILPVIALLGLATAGCRTTKDILDDYDKDIASGNYAHASIEVGEMAGKGDDSVALWRLQTAAAQYMANDPAAISTFDLVEDAYSKRDQTKAVGKAGETSLSMLTNERSIPYAGTGEDRIFTCFYKAVDYAAMNNFAAARTEFNRAAQYQDNWLWARREEIAEARKKLEADSAAYAREKNTTVDTAAATSAADKALMDASFTAKIRQGTGFDPQRDGNLDQLAQADHFNQYVDHAMNVFRWFNHDPGHSFVGQPRPVDRVWIYVEDGLCPVRDEWRIDLPLILIPYANRFIQYAGMALPKLIERGAAHNSYSVVAGSSQANMSLMQDVDKLTKTEFDVYMSGCLKREITRTIIKAGLQVGFGVAAETTNAKDAKLAFRIAQLGVATWAMTTTAADLRTWTALPKKVYALEVTRPADGHIEIRGGGAPIADITLPKGNSMIFVRKPTAVAPATVKTITFK